jgi:hypothetical protein
MTETACTQKANTKLKMLEKADALMANTKFTQCFKCNKVLKRTGCQIWLKAHSQIAKYKEAG